MLVAVDPRSENRQNVGGFESTLENKFSFLCKLNQKVREIAQSRVGSSREKIWFEFSTSKIWEKIIYER